MTLNIRHLIFGAGSTVLQIVVSSVSLLILYKLLLDIIGVGHLGVWSLILAASSFVHLANSGLTGGIVTHIADLEAKGEERRRFGASKPQCSRWAYSGSCWLSRAIRSRDNT